MSTGWRTTITTPSARPSDRDPAQPHPARVIAEHVQRRLAEHFARFPDRPQLAQDGLDQLDESVLEHGGPRLSEPSAGVARSGCDRGPPDLISGATPGKLDAGKEGLMENEAAEAQAGVGVADQPGDHHRARARPTRSARSTAASCLKLADECGAVAALRHAGQGQITTAAIDSMMFLGPVYVGERVEIVAEVTYVGRTSIETRIEIYAEPYDRPEPRTGRGRLCPVRGARRGRPAPAPGPAAADRDRGRPTPPRAGAVPARPSAWPAGPRR